MANRITNGSGRKYDARIEARNWIARGVCVVPLPPGSKGGRDLPKEWPKLRISSDEVDEHFKPGDNVGGNWGLPSNELVDIDLDCDEAVRAAKWWLPKSLIYGRGMRPRSHYVFRALGIGDTPIMKWLDPDSKGSDKKGMIVEFRCGGNQQSVLPGSRLFLDDSIDYYRIDEDRKPTEIDWKELRKLTNGLAISSLLARSYNKGTRHDLCSNVTSLLTRYEWSEAEISRVIGAMGDDEEDDQRLRTIRNTRKSTLNGGQTWGWPNLARLIPASHVEALRKWLEPTGLKITITNSKTRPAEAGNDYTPPDAKLLVPPGLVGEIAAWSTGRSYVLQPVFDLAVGLISTALCTVNRYEVAGRTALQPYFLLAAPTAGGKDNALSSVYQFARRLNLGPQCFQGFQSWHAMIDTLANPPHIACMLWDEVPRKLKGSQQGQDFQILTWLLSLYGKANSSTPGMPARGQAIPPIDFPFLTILGTAQPDALIKAITERDLDTGLINRFTLFDAGDGVAPKNERTSDVFPTRLEAAAKKLREKPLPTGERPFESINMSTVVHNRFAEFFDYSRQRSVAAGVGEMWGRANQNALIMAGVVAAGCDLNRPTITPEIADWAIAFARWSFTRWERRLDRQVARSRDESDSQRLEAVIRSARSLAKNPKWRPKQIALLKEGKVPRSVLCQSTRFLRGKNALNEKLEYLLEAGVIGVDTDEDVYWAI